MALKLALALGLLHLCAALPALTLQDLEVADDTMSVGSYIREVRAAAPDDYHKSYDNEGDGEIGYSRKKSGGGKKGYQHFDSYHKKAGDNYEFEKQDSFGLDEGAEEGAHSHPHQQRAKPDHARRYRKAEHTEPDHERYEYEEQEEPDKEHELLEKKKRSKKERHFEELKEGASDGNGGVEAQGHDPRDYILPAKYTWDDEE